LAKLICSNYWADQRIFTTAARVSQDQYLASTKFGNLQEILVHILSSEWHWRLGFQRYFVPLEVFKANPSASSLPLPKYAT